MSKAKKSGGVQWSLGSVQWGKDPEELRQESGSEGQAK